MTISDNLQNTNIPQAKSRSSKPKSRMKDIKSFDVQPLATFIQSQAAQPDLLSADEHSWDYWRSLLLDSNPSLLVWLVSMTLGAVLLWLVL